MPKVSSPPKGSTKTTPKKNGKPKPAPATPERPVVYPEIKARLYIGSEALTEEQAKEYIGWQEVDKGNSDLEDDDGKLVRLCHNLNNRKLDLATCKMYQQLHLEKQWKVNGETLIVGRTGKGISLQHRLVGFILACQEWRKNPERWPKWTVCPTFECIFIVGVDEDDETVNTIDTGRPRSFADVIYRSHYFAGLDNATRDTVSKMLAYAVHIVQFRTWARKDMFSQKRPHAEGLEFLDRHLTLLECVKHIREENGKAGRLSYYGNPGIIAGLMYLMASGTSDLTKYQSGDQTEKDLDFSNFDLASEFFVHLSQETEQFKALRDVAAGLLSDRVGGLSRDEGLGLLAKAWLQLTDGKPITDESVTLEYNHDESGIKTLAEFPTVGGIDQGNPDIADQADDDREPSQAEKDELEKERQKVQAEANGKKKAGGRKSKQKLAQQGQKVWVPEEGGHIVGFLQETYDAPSGTIAVIKMMNGKVTEAPHADCLTDDPNG